MKTRAVRISDWASYVPPVWNHMDPNLGWSCAQTGRSWGRDAPSWTQGLGQSWDLIARSWSQVEPMLRPWSKRCTWTMLCRYANCAKYHSLVHFGRNVRARMKLYHASGEGVFADRQLQKCRLTTKFAGLLLLSILTESHRLGCELDSADRPHFADSVACVSGWLPGGTDFDLYDQLCIFLLSCVQFGRCSGPRHHQMPLYPVAFNAQIVCFGMSARLSDSWRLADLNLFLSTKCGPAWACKKNNTRKALVQWSSQKLGIPQIHCEINIFPITWPWFEWKNRFPDTPRCGTSNCFQDLRLKRRDLLFSKVTDTHMQTYMQGIYKTVYYTHACTGINAKNKKTQKSRWFWYLWKYV